MKTTVLLIILLQAGSLFADDVYLHTGHVFLNVAIVDSTDTHYVIAFEDRQVRI